MNETESYLWGGDTDNKLHEPTAPGSPGIPQQQCTSMSELG